METCTKLDSSQSTCDRHLPISPLTITAGVSGGGKLRLAAGGGVGGGVGGGATGRRTITSRGIGPGLRLLDGRGLSGSAPPRLEPDL